MAIGVRYHSRLTGLNVGTIVRWTVTDEAARLALVLRSVDDGSICKQTDGPTYWILVGYAGPTWKQIDLQTAGADHGALSGRGDDDHTQYHTDARGDARYYTQTQADALLAAKSGTAHNHAGLYSEPGHIHDDRYYTEAEVDTALAGKAASAHTHDDRYYTESEADTLLAGKSGTGHDHDSRYYTESETDTLLAGKAAAVHAHDDLYFTETEVTAALATKEATANKGAAGGYASLDGTGRIPGAQLPVSALEYKGGWNATTNTPSLTLPYSGTAGDTYSVTTAGTQNLGGADGATDYAKGDRLLYDGADWVHEENTDEVGATGDAYAASHEADATAHPAANIVNTPAGGIAATTVQAAINELDTEKAAAAHTHTEAAVTDLDKYTQAQVTSLLAGKSDTAHTHDTLANVGTSTILGRTTAGSGNSEELTAAQARTLLNVADGATAAGATGDAYAASHEADGTAHAASAIVNTPAGGVAATTVQAAINELDTEKLASSAVSAFGASLVDDADAATARTTLDAARAPISGAGAPGASTGNGYALGQTYVDTTGDVAYTLVDATADANVWFLDADGATGDAHAAGDGSDHAAVAANTSKVTNATHTGDVTGATALTIADEAVTFAKMAHVATSTLLGRTTAASGDVEALTAAQVRTLLNVADGATAAGATGDAYATSHEADATAHAASAIVNTPAGGIAATTVQAAINELDTEKAAAGHAHNFVDLADVPSSYTGHGTKTVRVNAGETGLEFSAAGAGDVVGPASATDNALARFNATTGKLLQDSSNATLGDGGALALTGSSAEVLMAEKSGASAPGAGYSRWWAKNSTPNEPAFTDDTDNDLRCAPLSIERVHGEWETSSTNTWYTWDDAGWAQDFVFAVTAGTGTNPSLSTLWSFNGITIPSTGRLESVKIIWSPTTAPATFQTLQWQVRKMAITDGMTTNGTITQVASGSDFSSTSRDKRIVNLTIDSASLAANDQLFVFQRRIGGDTVPNTHVDIAIAWRQLL